MNGVLAAAAAYNLIWGTSVILWPDALFRWTGAPVPNYPQLWQCIGMIVGVYGVGYAIASWNPLRHWPIVLVGLLGKILGPLGFLWAVRQGTFPSSFGWTILANDVIWWLPFWGILRQVYRNWTDDVSQIHDPKEAAAVLDTLETQNGATLSSLSAESRVLVVFLRHAGCTFCREALSDIAAARPSLESAGTRIVLVHMSPEERAKAFFARFGLEDVDRISDPDRLLYRVFGLHRGRLRQLFGWNVWIRGFEAGILNRHGVGLVEGDGFQLPGVFLLSGGELRRSFRHRSAADRPDYEKFSQASPVGTWEHRN